MGQTLTNGIYLPDEGERNSYSGLEANWRTLDALILTVNGKAAPNIANTWTAAQTFTAGIAGDLTGNVTGNVTGDLTGTASKAIADEDGTSIKTGYVNVAGNQTVSGQKTWSGENLYTSNLNVSGFRIRLYDSTDDWTVTPANTVIKEIDFTDKNNSVISYFAFQHRSNTTEPFRTCWRQNKKDGTTDYYSVNFNNLGEFYPEISNTKLGTSSYQWSSVYAQTYYYNGTAWGLDKANTWTQSQTFNADTLYRSTVRRGTAPSSTVYMGFADYKDSANNRFSLISASYDTNKSSKCCLYAYNTTTASGNSIGLLGIGCNASGDVYTIAPTPASSDNSTQIATTAYVKAQGYLTPGQDLIPSTTTTYDLGTSTNKWKTINGYEPSMLGEVYVANEVNIDTTNWALDGSGWNTLATSIMSGWVYLAVTDCDADSFIMFRRGSNKAKNPTICFHPQHANSGIYYLYGLFMVPKNTSCIIAVKTGTNGVLSQALLYPCFGNV